jgi:hypothetical protein
MLPTTRYCIDQSAQETKQQHLALEERIDPTPNSRIRSKNHQHAPLLVIFKQRRSIKLPSCVLFVLTTMI